MTAHVFTSSGEAVVSMPIGTTSGESEVCREEIKSSSPFKAVGQSIERKLSVYDDVAFDPNLKPKTYHIKGE